jgi:hypothetical protein
MKASTENRLDPEIFLVAQIATCVSVLSFLYYLKQGDILLYGDVFGHINIARRVFDSRTPGLLELGTVWLPLPHLLMIPFLLGNWMWQTGIGGSIPSLIAYIFAVTGIFRLVRNALSGPASPDVSARRCAWIAALIVAANPNLIYMQATAMTEALYLGFAIWAVVYFAEFVEENNSADGEMAKPLMKCGFCLIGASLTRYDGWFLAVVVSFSVIALQMFGRRKSALTTVKFLLLAAAAPILWISYNAVAYRNPLEFANGPYSAKALSQKDAAGGTAPYPGAGSIPVASKFFLKSAELNVAEGNWGRFWLAIAFIGVCVLLAFQRRFWPLLLLWSSLPFYGLSMAYGGVPIYLPIWWPHGYYNVRYGLELIPAFAVFIAIALFEVLRRIPIPRARLAPVLLVLALVTGCYSEVWRAQPICFREALVNSKVRNSVEGALGENLKMLPPNSTILMYIGNHVGALQREGIPIRRTINENNTWPWRKRTDPLGLWEAALANPSQFADYVVAEDGDAVAQYVNRGQLTSLVVIHTSGAPPITIYSTPRARAGR